jgi:hypothetical protein
MCGGNIDTLIRGRLKMWMNKWPWYQKAGKKSLVEKILI